MIRCASRRMPLAAEIVVGRQGRRGRMTTRSPQGLNLSLAVIDNMVRIGPYAAAEQGQQ